MKFLKLFISVIILLSIPFLSQIGTATLFTGLDISLTDHIMLLVSVSNLLTLTIFLAFGFFKKQNFKEIYRLNPVPLGLTGHIITLGFSSMFFSAALSALFKLGDLDPEAIKTLNTLMHHNNTLLTILSVGIWVPIVEEVVFRGALTRLLSKNMNIYVAIVIQALLFGIFHFNLVQLIPTAILGLTMGLAAHYTKSLLPAIAIHMMNNSLAILMSQSVSSETASAMAQSAPPSPLIYVAMLVITGAILILTLRDLSRKSTQ